MLNKRKIFSMFTFLPPGLDLPSRTKLTPMVSQSEPEAGPSSLPENKEYPEAQSA
ncbi:hypothetical protein AZE42_03937 [Rhizopogon vesiculosus]|uniref:Uncharacterized protein n=1 Tax=Rhizopogon vesiculosus TaxID=180088 RepID=A0A1J8QF21_9AGAM|nr:hypothetical protein AZE42_03937 [Rhizopogon vesiculosus]